MNKEVEEYISSLSHWKDEIQALRDIILSSGLEEEYKWMRPCYTFKQKNVLLLHEAKEYCGISFFKWALLKDTKKLLTQVTKNIQSDRQLRFTSLGDIQNSKDIILSYIKEAIEIEKSGQKVGLKKTEDYEFPVELLVEFEKDVAFKEAFEKLTPWRQRGYLLFFLGAKQTQTRVSRIESNKEKIMDGKWLRDCTCWLSKRMPNCDGSHKYI